MLKSFALIAMLASTATVQAPVYYSTVAVDAGVLNMRANYAPMTCASMHIEGDCYNTAQEAMEAQLAIAAYEGDASSVAYYNAVLACYAENGVSILCEDD